ncbi:protein tramtrack, beta isoform isoform X1 [Anoplophora glabripennis]|uniref:protein tramtrack, beta isoform isoform X1 n=1 Tax=Anoplophora glabripennis TaxID=217634 RepID=UPI0008756583|nr:protein tramtrack, beta isoform isoform X1 [Anoplophora glabripennis]
MATTEQFSLRWNNFHSNLTSGFHELLEAAEMVDVTLAVDGHFFQAHKIVLSICSPYFKQMFKVNPCKHPIVILKDVGHENMKDILEFMYMGEVSVLRENLTQFLRTAELLQVKGLTGDDSSEETSSTKDNKADCDNDEENEMYNQLIETDVELPIYSSPPQVGSAPPPIKRPSKNSNTSTNPKRSKSEAHQVPQKPVKQEQEPVKSKNEYNSSDFMSLDSQAGQNASNKMKTETDDGNELMNMKNMWENNISAATSGDLSSSDQGRPEKVLGNKHLYQCGQCLKKFSRRDHLRTHEKNIHGEFAGPFKCVICGQLYKNTESLRKHIAKFHSSTINETIQRIELKA